MKRLLAIGSVAILLLALPSLSPGSHVGGSPTHGEIDAMPGRASSPPLLLASGAAPSVGSRGAGSCPTCSPTGDPGYPVTFSETGLPNGSTWWINVSGPSDSFTIVASPDVFSGAPSSGGLGGTATVFVPNGTYQVVSMGLNQSGGQIVVTSKEESSSSSIPAVQWYASAHQSLVVNGSGVAAQPLTLAPIASYPVTFQVVSSGDFTLIELLVVLLIIGILLAIAIPTFLSVTKTAGDTAVQSNLQVGLPVGNWSYYVGASSGITGPIQPIRHNVSGSSIFLGVGAGNTADFSTGTGGTFAVPAGAVTLPLTTVNPIPVYPLTFREAGLPLGSTWWINLSGADGLLEAQSFIVSASGSTTFLVPPGEIHWTAQALSGGLVQNSSSPNQWFNPVSGEVLQAAAPTAVGPIVFTPLPSQAVTFTVSGPPTGSESWISLSSADCLSGLSVLVGSPGSTTVELPTGPWKFTEVTLARGAVGGGALWQWYSSLHGSFVVNASALQLPPLTPTPVPSYPVSFKEAGLPPGVPWSVNLSGPGGDWYLNLNATASTGGSSYAFANISLPNGTVVFDPAGARGSSGGESSATGGLALNGSGATVPVNYTPDIALRFQESRLPAGENWSVDLLGRTLTNVSVPVPANPAASRGEIAFDVPSAFAGPPLAGRVSFLVGIPGGEGLAEISGPDAPNQTSGSLGTGSGSTTKWSLRFGALENLDFNESSLLPFEMYAGARWGVGLTPALSHGGPVPQFVSTNGTQISLVVPAGVVYRFAVLPPGPEYKALPSQGTIREPAHTFGKTIKFRFLTAQVTFSETGLVPGGRNWSVTVAGTIAGDPGAPTFRMTLSSTGTAIQFRLAGGSFSYTVTDIGASKVPSPGTGTLVVTVPRPTTTPIAFS